MKKKVVLITGASSGIGKATALLLNGQGCQVYAAARQVEKMKDLRQVGIQTLALDVTKEASMVWAVEHVIQEAGNIDILINNAGYGSYGALEDVPIAEAKYQFEVNLFGLARLIQLVLPGMRAKKAGKIINISSIGGRIGEPHGAWYHATKFAVERLSDSLRMELMQFGIEMIVIQPGAIQTEWNRIARENLLKVSGNTVYGDLAHKHSRMLEKADKRGSQPLVIAKVIQKAINARRSQARYAAGAGAKAILFLRKVLSDTAFDRLMLSQIKK